MKLTGPGRGLALTGMNSRRLAASLLIAVALSPAGAQTILVNGGFESEPNFGGGVSHDGGYTALTGSDLPGWTIEPGHGVTIHSTAAYPFITGSYSVNLDGEGYNGHNANFYQDFSSISGATYSLSFDWQGWYSTPGLVLQVTVVDFDPILGSTLFTGSYAHDLAGLHSESGTFTGTGRTLRLRIEEAVESGGNDNGFIVDNFAVTQTAIPEPSLAALLCGATALGAAVRNRKKESR
jgi:hypothetical protein